MTNYLKEILEDHEGTIEELKQNLIYNIKNGNIKLIHNDKHNTTGYNLTHPDVIDIYYTGFNEKIHELGHASALISEFSDEEILALMAYGDEAIINSITAANSVKLILEIAQDKRVNNFIANTLIDICAIEGFIPPITRSEKDKKMMSDPIWQFNELYANFYVIQNYQNPNTREKQAIRALKHIVGANLYNMYRSFMRKIKEEE